MRIHSAHISNFKGIKELSLDFGSPATRLPRHLTALLGDNGSGKTTVLQAIALTLSLATRRTRHVADYRWHGFLPERVSSLGPTRVELAVLLDDEEVQTTSALFREWLNSRPADWRQTHSVVPPSSHREVTLVYESGKITSSQGFEATTQFLGRHYVRELLKTQPGRRLDFARLGDVFWFDQHRNLGSAMAGRQTDEASEPRAAESWEAGVEQLREFLVGWWGYHTSPKTGGKDYIAIIEPLVSSLFPGTRFRGIMPREAGTTGRAADFYFLLENDGRVYDIAEMSSGEQAIFPLLYEFVRLDIAKSVILIDELELHLHPPQQQALLAALPRIGPDCQFIISTHSPYLEEVIPNEHEVRLEGGRRCL